jgi:hypothetical protein
VALNSRRKGKTGELEAAQVLREMFGWSTARSQQHCGTADSADLRIDQTPGLWWEIKRVERLCVPKTMRVAASQCGRRTPVLMHRPSRSEWLLTIRLSDLAAFVHAYQIATTDSVVAAALPPATTAANQSP